MFETALKAGLPMVAVRCDDPVNAMESIGRWAGLPAQLVDKLGSTLLMHKQVFVTTDEKLGTVENWQMLKKRGRTLVFLNCKHQGMAYDCGVLLPPDEQMREFMNEYMTLQEADARLPALRGLTIKQADELLMLTSVKYKNVSLASIKAMRRDLGQTISGLYPLDVNLPYYEPLPELEQWLAVNRPYFLGKNDKLAPRGLMFEGPPGTGKTMASMYLADKLGVPLFRVDTATTLTKYLGESEGRLAQSLALIDRESPCVALFDEVEKIFSTDTETSVIQRMLSQLLWWLEQRKARVLAVMTSNNLGAVPPELYRPGRIDRVFKIPLLDAPQAQAFSRRLLTDIMSPVKPTLKQLHALTFVGPDGEGQWSHSQIKAMIVNHVKTNGWITA